MDQLPTWFLLGAPLGCAAFALLALAWSKHEVSKFDRRYGKRG